MQRSDGRWHESFSSAIPAKKLLGDLAREHERLHRVVLQYLACAGGASAGSAQVFLSNKMTPKRITVHCSDSPNGKPVSVDAIRKFHMQERGWSDIGYHFIIQPSGEVDVGRALDVQGAHVLSHNADNVGICLIGCNKYTVAQFTALRDKIDSLLREYAIPPSDIYCHYEWDSAELQGKTCPNINIHHLLCWYYTQSPTVLEPYLLPPVVVK